MFRFGHNLQIFGAIVGGVFVDVVNNLRLAQKTPKLGLHDEPVFHDISLAVCVGVSWDESGAVCTMPPVGDHTLKVGVSLPPHFGALPRGLTFHRAEFLASLPRVRNVRSALAAFVLRSLAPSPDAVAGARTILSGLLPAIFGVKCLVACLASQGYSWSSHEYHITESVGYYCEIAAQRCAQEVLDLGAAA